MNALKAIGLVTGAIGLFVVALILGPLLTYFLWNWVVPDVFGGPSLTGWQAVGLFCLSHVLLPGSSGGKK